MADPLAGLENMHAITMEQVKAKAENDRRYRTTEADAVREFGANRIERKYRKDGNYSWRVRRESDRDMTKMRGMVEPWAKAEVARIADQNGYPGDYGKGLKGKVTLLARHVAGDWCKRCDRLAYWCECHG